MCRLNHIIILLLIVTGISSCKKEMAAPAPQAAFTVGGIDAQSYVVVAGDSYPLGNNSVNTYSYAWDFGDGTISREKEPPLSYGRKGSYNLTLTARAIQDERTSVTHKKVEVIGPVIKQVILKTLNWDQGVPGRAPSWPQFTKADIWIEILQGAPNQTYPVLSNGSLDAPVVYKSNIINADPTAVPIIFNVPQPVAVDLPTLYRRFGYYGTGYGINVYARDGSGTYLLSSNYWSGVSIIYRKNPSTNSFTIATNFQGNLVEISGNFE
jgi:PKD repeat protein